MANRNIFLSALSLVSVIALIMPALGSEATATRKVTIRSGPGVEFEVVGKLAKNENVDKRNCTNDQSWCYVTGKGPAGWVASAFLFNVVTPTTPPVVQPTPSNSDHDYFAKSQVNVRTGPGTSFEIVDRLEANDTVRRVQCMTDAKWCYVDHTGSNGWVSNKFLLPLSTDQDETPDFEALPYIARSHVNVRSGPGTSFSKLDRLDAHEQVTRNQCLPDGSWCYITHNGPDGWVAASFIYPEGQSQEPNDPNPSPPNSSLKYGVTITGMPVRNAPSLFTGTTGRIEKNTSIAIDKCSNDGYWCHIKSTSVEGWIPAAFIRIEQIQTPTSPQDNVAYTTKRIFMRDGPGLEYSVIGAVNENKSVEISECDVSGKWCRVTRKNRTGWVVAKFLELPIQSEPTPTAPAPQPTTNQVCFEGFGGIRVCLE